VPGPDVEVGTERAHVHGNVRDRLRAVHEDHRARGVGAFHDLGHRVDGAEDVRDMAYGDELRAAGEQLLEGSQLEQAVGADRHEAELRPGALGQHLPGDEVGVVLHLGEHDEVAGGDVGRAPRVGDEVDRLRGVAGEDRLPGNRPGQGGDVGAGGFEGFRSLGGQRVYAAVHAGPVVAVVGVHGLHDHDRRL
jgi:hypothetical protein